MKCHFKNRDSLRIVYIRGEVVVSQPEAKHLQVWVELLPSKW